MTESKREEPAADDQALDEVIADLDASDVTGSSRVPAEGGGLEQLQEQLKSAEDRALRSQAELENFRRRSRRERDEERRFANQGLLTDIFPVIDNIDRALSAAGQSGSDSGAGLLEGFRMVAQQLLDALGKHACCRIEAAGQAFDPERQEAVSQLPSPDVPAGQVLQVVQQGYLLHDRVIRPAQVIVSAGPAADAE